MKTMYLEKDQQKPQAFTDDGKFFAISKIKIGGNDKRSQMHHMMDIFNRQVFH